MNVSHYIASILSIREGASSNKGVSRIVSVSLWSVAISIVAMILSVFVVKGFQKEVQQKVIQFDAHLRVGKFDFNDGVAENPVKLDGKLLADLKTDKCVKDVNTYAEKGGIIKTKEEVHGVLVKGIDEKYRNDFFAKNLVEGSAIAFKDEKASNDVIISRKLSDILNLKLHDKLRVYFVQKPIRVRAFKIVGVYESGLEQFDSRYVFADVKHIQKLNGWTNSQFEGYEVFLNNYEDLFQINDLIFNAVGYELNHIKITDKYAEIFGWLDLLDMNVIIILSFAILVSLVNMLSTLLIVVLEKTKFIGTLKVLGANNKMVVKVFTYLSLRIILRGMLIGNGVALLIAFIQHKFGVITLDEATYYVDKVPIYFDWTSLALINMLTLLACFMSVIVPSFVIARIKPSSAIKFS